MQETKSLALGRRKRRPVRPCFFEQRKRADHVGLDELARAVYRAVDVALGCEMHDRVRTMCGEQARDELAVRDIASYKNVARIVFQGCKVLQIACVRELVE